jgi:hypothetical protein
VKRFETPSCQGEPLFFNGVGALPPDALSPFGGNGKRGRYTRFIFLIDIFLEFRLCDGSDLFGSSSLGFRYSRIIKIINFVSSVARSSVLAPCAVGRSRLISPIFLTARSFISATCFSISTSLRCLAWRRRALRFIADVLHSGVDKRAFAEVENNTAHGQPEYFFSNHDQPRQWDRYGDGGVHNDHIAKLMATLLLTTRGTPQMYYGEEVGMRTTAPPRIEDVHDPIGKLGWPKEEGRDGERTPMQWDPSAGAGFTSSVKPWLPIPPNASIYNVETEKQNPDSIGCWLVCNLLRWTAQPRRS